MELNYVQPQNPEMEKAVLGAILHEGRSAYEVVKDYMTEHHFYMPDHRFVFKAMTEVYKANAPIDLLSVMKQLRANNHFDVIGGAYFLSQLTNGVNSAMNIDYHGKVVYEKFLGREMIRIGQSITQQAYQSEDITDLMNTSITELRQLENRLLDEGKSDDIDRIIERTFAAMDHAKQNQGVLGHSIGIKSIDAYLNGLQKKTVYVIAARPGMGKSALVKTIFVNLALQKVKVKLFSLEVSAEKFMMNIMSDILETNNQNIFKGELTEDQKIRLRNKLSEVKSYMDIDDKAGITIQYLEKKVKKAVREGCQVIMIDYLQLMTVLKSDANPTMREQVVSFLSTNIKRIASENDIPIIELAQLSREVEKRVDKRPGLSDLRESGAIEQDAEVVMFIYRPEYYGTKKDKQDNDLTGLAQVIFAKNRNGPLGAAVVKFTPEFTKFEDFLNPESSPGLFDEGDQNVHSDNNDPQF